MLWLGAGLTGAPSGARLLLLLLLVVVVVVLMHL